jgi:hypothetical protein
MKLANIAGRTTPLVDVDGNRWRTIATGTMTTTITGNSKKQSSLAKRTESASVHRGALFFEHLSTDKEPVHSRRRAHCNLFDAGGF